MAADLTKLVPELRTKLDSLLKACAKRGVTMRPYDGLRTPLSQGKIWRQSRSIEAINAKVAELKAGGANFLAKMIVDAGSQSGPEVTNSIPGLSWHQWGEACDCFWLVNGGAEWSTTKKINGVNGYRVYAEEAPKVGLTAGGNWSSFKDWPHVQLNAANSPLSAGMTLLQVDAEMKKRFGP
jgi:peptidoglycan L-alanyl-D-glutamate endopeptidase CwlK